MGSHSLWRGSFSLGFLVFGLMGWVLVVLSGLAGKTHLTRWDKLTGMHIANNVGYVGLFADSKNHYNVDDPNTLQSLG